MDSRQENVIMKAAEDLSSTDVQPVVQSTPTVPPPASIGSIPDFNSSNFLNSLFGQLNGLPATRASVITPTANFEVVAPAVPSVPGPSRYLYDGLLEASRYTRFTSALIGPSPPVSSEDSEFARPLSTNVPSSSSISDVMNSYLHVLPPSAPSVHNELGLGLQERNCQKHQPIHQERRPTGPRRQRARRSTQPQNEAANHRRHDSNARPTSSTIATVLNTETGTPIPTIADGMRTLSNLVITLQRALLAAQTNAGSTTSTHGPGTVASQQPFVLDISRLLAPPISVGNASSSSISATPQLNTPHLASTATGAQPIRDTPSVEIIENVDRTINVTQRLPATRPRIAAQIPVTRSQTSQNLQSLVFVFSNAPDHHATPRPDISIMMFEGLCLGEVEVVLATETPADLAAQFHQITCNIISTRNQGVRTNSEFRDDRIDLKILNGFKKINFNKVAMVSKTNAGIVSIGYYPSGNNIRMKIIALSFSSVDSDGFFKGAVEKVMQNSGIARVNQGFQF